MTRMVVDHLARRTSESGTGSHRGRSVESPTRHGDASGLAPSHQQNPPLLTTGTSGAPSHAERIAPDIVPAKAFGFVREPGRRQAHPSKDALKIAPRGHLRRSSRELARGQGRCNDARSLEGVFAVSVRRERAWYRVAALIKMRGLLALW